MAKSSTRRVTIYINGREVGASGKQIRTEPRTFNAGVFVQVESSPYSGLLRKKNYFCTVEQTCMNHDRTYYSTRPVLASYASPYLVITPQGYTKHYYAGAERVTSQLGKGQFADVGTPVVDDSLVQAKLQAVTGNVRYPVTLTAPSSSYFSYLDTLTNRQQACNCGVSEVAFCGRPQFIQDLPLHGQAERHNARADTGGQCAPHDEDSQREDRRAVL